MARNVISIGAQLREIWQRSGMSMRDLAKRMGYANSSSIQRYLSDDYGIEGKLPVTVAEKFAAALAGLGSPAIEPNDIYELAGVEVMPGGTLRAMSAVGVINLGANEVVVADFTNHQLIDKTMPRDVPVYGTALATSLQVELGDESYAAVEQTFLNPGEAIDYMRRPASLHGRKDIYAAHIVGSSMYPRFSEGQRVLVETKRPPSVGDDVIVQLAKPLGEDGEEVAAVLIKTLVRRTADYIELEQFNPPIRFRIETKRVSAVHRVMPWDEVLSF